MTDQTEKKPRASRRKKVEEQDTTVIELPAAAGELVQTESDAEFREIADENEVLELPVLPLRDTVVFYNKGRGNAVPEGMTLYLHWHISDPKLTDREVDRLVDFMQALTDETFMPEVPKRVPSGLKPIDNPPQRAAATRTALAPQNEKRGGFR